MAHNEKWLEMERNIQRQCDFGRLNWDGVTGEIDMGHVEREWG